ncbi:MAG: LPS export ABC transporter periplasmic protein LptC [Candidatus Krumholzibacteriia bacterium]
MTDSRRRHLHLGLRRRPWPVLVGLGCLLACGEAADPAAQAAAGGAGSAAVDSVLPEQTFYDYRLIESTEGVKQWVLDSDVMYKYKNRRTVDLVRVAMDFFRDGELHATLLADSGLADTHTHDVHVWSNVVITTEDGRRLRTRELFYTSSDGLIRNDVYNVFDRGPDVVTGIGLEATPDLDYLVIKDQVAGVVGDDAADAPGPTERPGDTP